MYTNTPIKDMFKKAFKKNQILFFNIKFLFENKILNEATSNKADIINKVILTISNLIEGKKINKVMIDKT